MKYIFTEIDILNAVVPIIGYNKLSKCSDIKGKFQEDDDLNPVFVVELID